MAIVRNRAGLPTLISESGGKPEVVMQKRIRTALKNEPPGLAPKTVADQETIAAHNRRVLAARQAQAKVQRAAAIKAEGDAMAAQALATKAALEAISATQTIEEQEGEPATAEEFETVVPEASVAPPTLINPTPAAPVAMGPAATPRPAAGPTSNATPGKPQPLGVKLK